MTVQHGPRHLLDVLAENLGCGYLSDLRMGQRQAALWEAVACLRAEDFPAEEWWDALEYLAGCAERLPAEKTRLLLLKELEHSS